MSFDEPLFLDVEDVVELHATQLEVYGGSAGLRDRGLLESAVAQPQASFGGEFTHEGLSRWQQLTSSTSSATTRSLTATSALVCSRATIFRPVFSHDYTPPARKEHQWETTDSERSGLNAIGPAHW